MFTQAPSIWEIGSAIGSFGAAIAAAATIWVAQRDSRRRATFEQLREINVRLQALGGYEIADVQRELLRYYGHNRDDLPPGGRLYLDLLDSLELLAFAVEERAVDKRIAVQYVCTILLSPMTPYVFLLDLQRCCGDGNVYGHLSRLILHENIKHQRPTTQLIRS